MLPVYLSLKNPKVIEKWPDSIVNADNYRRAQAVWFDKLKTEGYDGVIQGDTYVAFKPEQIKSAIGNKGTFDPTKPNILERRGDAALKPVGTPEAMEAVLRDKFGDKLVQGLLDQGLLKMIAKADDVRETPPTAKAVYREGPRPGATLYVDKLRAEEVPGVLMHELGEHFGIRRLLGDERYRVMLGELREIRNEPEVRDVWKTVKKNYKLDESDPSFLREVAAHLVEQHPDLPFVRRLVNEIRAYFYQHFGTTMGNRVDANLVRGLAAAALRSASKGELTRRPMRFDGTPIPASRPSQNRAMLQ